MIAPIARDWEDTVVVWERMGSRSRSHRIPADAVGLVVKHSGQHIRALILGRVWSIDERRFRVVQHAGG